MYVYWNILRIIITGDRKSNIKTGIEDKKPRDYNMSSQNGCKSSSEKRTGISTSESSEEIENDRLLVSASIDNDTKKISALNTNKKSEETVYDISD